MKGSVVRRRLLEELGGGSGKDLVLVSAPGRADFLNTHQDYKGLPVVPVAVKLRCYSMGFLNGSNVVRFASLNLKESGREYRDEFELDGLECRGGGWFGDYVRSIFKAFTESGCEAKGMDIALWSEVPIGAGLSSSASLEVSIAKLVSELCGLGLDRKTLAEIAFKAEHDIMGIPCGRLDQYASAFGGVIKIETRPPFDVEELPAKNLVFVISDSGEHRRIISVHPIRQREINQALKLLLDEVKIPPDVARHLSRHFYETRWESVLDSLENYLGSLPEKLANRLRFTLRTHRSTMYAIEILKGRKPRREEFIKAVGEDFAEKCKVDFEDSLSVIGAIMNYQHLLLRDLYEVSTRKLEELRKILLDAGALGAKISGAGLGGAIIALARDLRSAEEIRKKCIEEGFSSTWSSTPDEGARKEPF